MKKIISILTVFSTIVLFAQKNVDLIITNAKIYTVNQNFDTAESMVISNGKIMAIGKSADLLKKFKSKNIQNLQKAKYRLIIITGDNILTAIKVGLTLKFGDKPWIL